MENSNKDNMPPVLQYAKQWTQMAIKNLKAYERSQTLVSELDITPWARAKTHLEAALNEIETEIMNTEPTITTVAEGQTIQWKSYQ